MGEVNFFRLSEPYMLFHRIYRHCKTMEITLSDQLERGYVLYLCEQKFKALSKEFTGKSMIY